MKPNLEQRRAARAERQRLQAAAKAAKWAAPPGWEQAWFDGSARPNPGRIGIGALLRSPAGEETHISRSAGHGDSARAECLALIAVLEMALAANAAPLLVQGDSRVVIDAVLGHASASGLEDLCAEARRLMARCESAELRWVPRARNAAADALSQQAFSG